ncbi:MAG: aminodeoxychorismate synthase component I [Edaphobacter sp.]|uniref:aminodeoxychorismate synthase component I n=1 Tax=Edaphobacter sp. TaxID=1934404 RepID=UPI002382FCCF|nr:aminodeoxychorismate synthase component I [Edaphobacter sp.]MDE1177022.1 aminodeoxychorismate synthase component I [Edaphobacter sp.]
MAAGLHSASRSHFYKLPGYVRALAAQSRDAVLLETARCDAESRYSYLFLDPMETLAAGELNELPALFERIEEALKQGQFVAGYAGYECGAHFAMRQGRSVRRGSGDLPLAWFGVYARPLVFDHVAGKFVGDAPPLMPEEVTPDEPLPQRVADVPAEGLRLAIGEGEYVAAIEKIQQYIAAGDTYQVNFTDAVSLQLDHGVAASFGALLEAQPVSYAALLRVEGHEILSLSPELFFHVDARDAGDGARRIVTRPMKGTMRRGLDLDEDAVQAALLASDEKNRSEHVMIVDLLRNDLGRICEMGSVAVEDLFTVERYRTLLQMTSTVAGRLRGGVGWYEVFRALFPSGSITGAPKVRTMEIIEELEHGPRGVYTGAIGYFAPDGAAQFNVAIRTLVVKDGAARMGVGGGIVADSQAEAEYRECQLKASFLAAERTEFELIETMLAEDGVVKLLPLHLDRLCASAEYFGFAHDRDVVERAIQARLSELGGGRFRLRLLLNRSGAVTFTHAVLAESGGEIEVCLSRHRVDSRDVFLRHKTTRRGLYDREFAAAREAGFDEVLFCNERGEVAEGAISTVFVQREGTLWTPPLDSGVLPGVQRRSLLDGGAAEERVLTLRDLEEADAVYLGNGVRGLRRVSRLVNAAGEVVCDSLDVSSVR